MRIAVNTIIFVGLFLIILPLIIQIIVCKNTKGKWGLIIPILSFLNVTLWLIGQMSFDAVGGEKTTIATFIGAMLVGNIPTLIYFLIYLHYKNKKKQKDELDKMEIMDMWQPGIIPGFLILHFVTNDGDKTTLSNACTGL